MRKIVAIGGGEIGRPGFSIETREIDEEIIRLSGKKSPSVLFIPTASKDAAGYVSVFEKYYRDLGCTTDVLYLNTRAKTAQIKEKIFSSDIIYVGGGNTLQMMTLWRRLGVDKYLREAWEKGIVMSGLSAGAICWFTFGHSDSRKFTTKKGSWNFIKVKGLGLQPFVFCPHYHFEKREKDFQTLIKRDGGIGLAFDNKTALEIVDDKFRVLKSDHRAKAYLVRKINGIVKAEELVAENFTPLKSLT